MTGSGSVDIGRDRFGAVMPPLQIGITTMAEAQGLSEITWARVAIRDLAYFVTDATVLRVWALSALDRSVARARAGDLSDAREDARLAVDLFDAAVGAEVVTSVRASAGGARANV